MEYFRVVVDVGATAYGGIQGYEEHPRGGVAFSISFEDDAGIVSGVGLEGAFGRTCQHPFCHCRLLDTGGELP